jgi:hypothetical protein
MYWAYTGIKSHHFIFLCFAFNVTVLCLNTLVMVTSGCPVFVWLVCIVQNILWHLPGPYLRTGYRGLGPGRQISRAGILKKLRLKYGMRIKKDCPREKFKGDIYWKHYNVLFFVSFLCCFCLHLTHNWIRTKFSWVQGRKVPKDGPGIFSQCATEWLVVWYLYLMMGGGLKS